MTIEIVIWSREGSNSQGPATLLDVIDVSEWVSDKARDETPRPGDERERTLGDAERCTGGGSLSPAMVDESMFSLGQKAFRYHNTLSTLYSSIFIHSGSVWYDTAQSSDLIWVIYYISTLIEPWMYYTFHNPQHGQCPRWMQLVAGNLPLVASLTGIGRATLALRLAFFNIFLLARPTAILHMW